MARSSRRGRLLLLGAAAVAAGVFLKRDKVAGLLPSRAETYSPPAPGPSNYDAPGPVANTATAVPVPEAYEPEPVDEAAEEAAAAAEAANIGGPAPDYAAAAEPGQLAPDEEVPVAEAGEGESEGAEQAEASVEDRPEEPTEASAEPTAPPEERPVEDKPSEWRTWSGRSVNP